VLQVDGTAPYAPTKAVIAVIERHRQVALPSLGTDVLERMGITKALAPRTAQTMRLLELADANEKPTDAFEAIRTAPSDQYRGLIADLLRKVYAPVFTVVDATTATIPQIEDAFRKFIPPVQRPRMVTLFTGLMAYAGMIPEAPKQTPGPRPGGGNGVRKANQRGKNGEAARKAAASTPRQADGGTGRTQTVLLKTGGWVSLSYDFNLFDVDDEDQEFVLGIVKMLRGYQAEHPAMSTEEAVS
jgi:hypothetical protein